MKICATCGLEKELSDFYLAKTTIDKRSSMCKMCKKEYNKNNHMKHKEKINKKSKEWATQNCEKRAAIDARYYKKNKYRKFKYYKEKLHKDLQFRMAHNLRKRMTKAIKNNCKSGSAVYDLGCSIEFFKCYIEQKFAEGMSWDNYGKWHLDHIIPLASFDLTDREQFIRACHYTNLQPLWAKDNLVKSYKMIWSNNNAK